MEISGFQVVDIVFFEELVVPKNLVETINAQIASGLCEQTSVIAESPCPIDLYAVSGDYSDTNIHKGPII